jgi:hypothetical protein
MQEEEWSSVAAFEEFDLDAGESDHLARHYCLMIQSVLPGGVSYERSVEVGFRA